MSNPKGEIRICVACLAGYNNGVLHGRWIDAGQEGDAIRDEIAAMLEAPPYHPTTKFGPFKPFGCVER